MSIVPSFVHSPGFGLIRLVSASILIKIVGAGLGFASAVVAALLLGATQAGIYFLAITIVTVVSVLSRAGTDAAVVRLTATGAHGQDWGAVRGVYHAARRLVLIVSSIVSAILLVTATWLSEDLFGKPELGVPLAIVALAVVPTTFCYLHAQLLQGLGKSQHSIALLVFWTPAFLVCGLPVAIRPFGTAGATIAYVFAATATAIVAYMTLRRAAPTMRTASIVEDKAALYASSRAQFWVSAFQMAVAWLPTLALGSYVNSAEVGVFSAANRTALLIGFILVAVNNVSAPSFAALYRQGAHIELASFVARITRLVLLVAAPVLLAFILGADLLMRLFGDEFADGANLLRILVLGQFLGLFGGPAGTLLAMSGQERLYRNSTALSAILVMVLCVLLLPAYGAVGVAIAASSSIAFTSLTNAYFVWKKLGIAVLPVSTGTRASGYGRTAAYRSEGCD